MNAEGLSQRLLTDAKLFRPLASQWAKGGIHVLCDFRILTFCLFSGAGTDVEDSLYWIAYATQPSNIVPGPVTPSPLQPEGATTTTAAANAPASADGAKVAGDTGAPSATATAAEVAAANSKYLLRREHEELRRRIAVEAMGLSQRVPRVKRQCEHEQERIARLAEVYQVNHISIVEWRMWTDCDCHSASVIMFCGAMLSRMVCSTPGF